MLPEILLILKPNVNWFELLDNYHFLTGRKLTESLDSSPIQLSDMAKVLVALYSMRVHAPDPLTVLRNCLPFVGTHMLFGFLVAASSEVFSVVQAYTQLHVLHAPAKDYNVGVMTANLQIWQQTITHCSIQMTDIETRTLFNKFQLWFEKEGLGNIFDNYAKIDMKDNSFKLEYKK